MYMVNWKKIHERVNIFYFEIQLWCIFDVLSAELRCDLKPWGIIDIFFSSNRSSLCGSFCLLKLDIVHVNEIYRLELKIKYMLLLLTHFFNCYATSIRYSFRWLSNYVNLVLSLVNLFSFILWIVNYSVTLLHLSDEFELFNHEIFALSTSLPLFVVADRPRRLYQIYIWWCFI